MKKTLCAFLALLLAASLVSCGSAKKDDEVIAEGTLEPQYVVEDEIIYSGFEEEASKYPGDIDRSKYDPVTRLVAVSGPVDTASLEKLTNAVNAYAATCRFPNVDGILICGSVTGGSLDTLDALGDYFANKMDDTTMPFVSPSSAESSMLEAVWKDHIGFDPDRNITLNETHVITISPDESGSYSSKKGELLDKLTSLEEADKEAPIVVMTGEENPEELTATFAKHPQVVLITPTKPTDDTAKKGEFTQIFVGDTSAYHVIEFDEDGRMLVLNIDENGKPIEGAEWFIQTPWIAEK